MHLLKPIAFIIVLLTVYTLNFHVSKGSDSLEQAHVINHERTFGKNHVSAGDLVLPLVWNHPREEIRKWGHMINRGQIILAWTHDPSADAQFTVLPFEQVATHVSGYNIRPVKPGSEMVPVLKVNPYYFSRLHRKRLEVTLWHEYQHYLQWYEDRYPEILFVFEPNPDRHLIKQDCDSLQDIEGEAYWNECQFAEDIGLKSVEGLCLAWGDQDRFVQELKHMLTASNPQCSF